MNDAVKEILHRGWSLSDIINARAASPIDCGRPPYSKPETIAVCGAQSRQENAYGRK
jgi:hypothetical protein